MLSAPGLFWLRAFITAAERKLPRVSWNSIPTEIICHLEYRETSITLGTLLITLNRYIDADLLGAESRHCAQFFRSSTLKRYYFSAVL